MARVHYDRRSIDYNTEFRPIPWNSNWIELPRLYASAVAVAIAGPETVVDPACGDGTVVLQAHALNPIQHALLADISANTIEKILPKELPFEADVRVGEIFDTLNSIDQVDCVVLTEILEHLEDPDALLQLAATKAKWLVASSPIVEEGVQDHTDQHIWSFDMKGYSEMLEGAGWNPKTWFTANCLGHPYSSGFQVWGASR